MATGIFNIYLDGVLQGTTGGGGSTIDGYETVANVATAETKTGTDDTIIYVVETFSWYKYESTAGAEVRDGEFILDTGDGGNTRWLAIAGKYIYDELNIGGKTIAQNADFNDTLKILNGKALRLQNATNSSSVDIQNTGGAGVSVLTLTGDVVIEGNTTVQGTTTTIESTTLTVEDKNIEMGVVATPDDITANGGGITLKGATDKTIIWDNVNENWTSSEHWNLASGKEYKIDNVTKLDETSVYFDTTNVTAPLEGEVNWNAEAGTLQVGLPGGGSNQIGQEVEFRAKATETILNGQVVYISGATGAVKEVSLVDSSNFDEACKTIAIATEDVALNNQGRFTTFGEVRGINTDSFNEGDEIYVNTSGNLTNVLSTVGECIVKIGIVARKHATEGIIFANITVERTQTQNAILKEPTGFYEPENVTVSYDSTARTITLGGTVYAFYRGKLNSTIVSGWTSLAHPTTLDKRYFLVYDGSTIQWLDLDVDTLDFSDLLIAYVSYGTTDKWALRECHGLMQWQGHRSDHFNIGTYRLSGGTVGDYTLASTTTTDRQPSVSATVLIDEDLPTTNPTLASSGNYTHYYLSATDTPNFDTTATDIVPLSGNQPYWNENNAGTWQQTLLENNEYMCVWLIAIPTSADAGSQAYRYVWQQGQFASSNLEDVESRTPQQVDRGQFEALTPESIYIGRIIIKYQGGNWELTSVDNLTGNRLSQATSPAGLYLSTVSSTSNFTGLGTINSPLDLSGTFTPTADSTTAFQFFKADGLTPVLTIDTINERVYGESTMWSKAFQIDNADGTFRSLTYRSNGDARWGLLTNNAAESGSNAGSDFQISRYTDAGTFIDAAMFIERATGNVGIGTISPSQLLEVAAEDGGGISLGERSVLGNLYIGREALGIFGGNSGWINFGSNIDEDNFIAFGTLENGVGGGERMRIAPNGNVGIGTDIPDARLHVRTGAANDQLILDNFAYKWRWSITSGGDMYFKDPSGGIFEKFNESGEYYNVGVRDNTTASGANVNINVTTGQILRSTSSIKYKTDVEDLWDSESEFIYNLRPVYYRSKSEIDPDNYGYQGFIAEEVDKLGDAGKRFVYYRELEDGTLDPDGVQYERFVVPIIKELQKLKNEIGKYTEKTTDEALDDLMSEDVINNTIMEELAMLRKVTQEQQKQVQALTETLEAQGFDIKPKLSLWDKIKNLFTKKTTI